MTFIGPSGWLTFIDQEYLRTFVRQGGSAVKFAVPLDDAWRLEIFDGLTRMAGEAGYLVAKIDAAQTKVHMADEIFFRTAEQVPWQTLSRRFVAKLAADSGYVWAEDGEDPLYLRLADRNQVDPQMLLLDLKKEIGNKVFRQRRLSRDFRVAMTHLCIAELSGGQDGATTVGILTDWLTGRNKAASAVKPYHIFRKINRATARFFFESMVRWLRVAAYPGLVVLLDAQRLMLARNPNDLGLFYSKAAVLDTYEVLRQYIDGADNLEGFFMVVVPDVTFLEDPGRGIGAYEALKFRVFDEIRDRNLVNPMASLARISNAVRE
ncbi:MAG TPA: BREX system ATP-binding domain-containing protein [Bryobacteraceae bacterium]|nr:BREX system ATP-binding domain-containing protein [Bryobacteraceae bacterium]